jgi:hypothetical protein
MSTFTNAGDGDDGVDASTTNPQRNGLFGINTATTPRNADVPGGNGVFGFTEVPDGAGVFGAHNTGGIGVAGIGHLDTGVGVVGFSDAGDGVVGRTQSSAKSGVFGVNDATAQAVSPGGAGVFGLTVVPGAAGVFGANNGSSGRGVQGNGPEHGVGGFSDTGVGMAGWSNQGDGAQGFTGSSGNSGVFGRNTSTVPVPSGVPGGNGVFGFTDNPNASGVFGAVAANNTGGAGVTGAGPMAGLFLGNVQITGRLDAPTSTITCFDVVISNADCAEEFDIADSAAIIEPGTVVSFDGGGTLRPSADAYDKRVAGVISGAGEYRPGIVLDKKEGANRLPVALVGKVSVKADASYGPIEVGDLLTTSPTSGHAMKAADPARAFGAVIGKALQPLQAGQGMLHILVALQ